MAMVEFVTADEARNHLRLDAGSADDAWLDLWIPVVSDAVLSWLKDEWRAYVPELGTDGQPLLDSSGDQIPKIDSNGLMTPRPQVRGAVLLELANLSQFRAGEGKDNMVTPEAGWGYVLNKGSTAMLAPLRKPTIG
jgi:hypothetical protein